MPSYFLDTSALAKLYHREAGSELVSSIAADPHAEIFVSRLAIVEMESVIAIKVRTGEIGTVEQRIARLAFQNDLASGRFKVIELRSHEIQVATQLLVAYGVSEGLRTLDALQLSVAFSLRLLPQSGPTEFVAADARLCRIANLENFSSRLMHGN